MYGTQDASNAWQKLWGEHLRSNGHELGAILGNVMRFLSFSGNTSWADLSHDFGQIFMPLLIGGTVLGVIAWVPQLNEVWKQKKHEGSSLPTLYLICTALLLWLVYGFIIGSIAIIISNLAALYCILIIIFGVNKLRKTDAYLFFTKIWVSLIQK